MEEQKAETAKTDEASKTADVASAAGPSKTVALTEGLGGILGVKAGVTQYFTDAGQALAVTVIDLQPNRITQVRTSEKDGYKAVQIGFLPKKEKNTTKPEQGRLKNLQEKGFSYYQEFRMPETAKMEGLEVGKLLDSDFIKDGDFVDLTAISKGKGFQGVVKRYHFSGGPKSHGASVVHRAPGSIGNRADPSKVFKNKKMAGHMGHVKVTVQNVRVVKVDKENGLLLVNGSVPGPTSGVVSIRRAVKKLN